VSADKLVATPVELEVQLNETFEYYQVGVAVSVTSSDVVSWRHPINWADCIHPRYACTFATYTLTVSVAITKSSLYVLSLFTLYSICPSVRLSVCHILELHCVTPSD